MTTVRKRDPRMEAEYYVSGNTVRRNVSSAQTVQRQPVQRNGAQRAAAQWGAAQWESTRWEPATRRYSHGEPVQTRRSETTRRVNERPQRPTARYAEPMRDVRTRQGDRRAEAPPSVAACCCGAQKKRGRSPHCCRGNGRAAPQCTAACTCFCSGIVHRVGAYRRSRYFYLAQALYCH